MVTVPVGVSTVTGATSAPVELTSIASVDAESDTPGTPESTTVATSTRPATPVALMTNAPEPPPTVSDAVPAANCKPTPEAVTFTMAAAPVPVFSITNWSAVIPLPKMDTVALFTARRRYGPAKMVLVPNTTWDGVVLT